MDIMIIGNGKMAQAIIKGLFENHNVEAVSVQLKGEANSILSILAGSGPAFLALVAEAISDGGVKEGLKREDAAKLVLGLFEGFIPLLKDKHPAIIKDEVMSPGGTTAAGYAVLEEGRTRDSFIKAIQKAYERAK